MRRGQDGEEVIAVRKRSRATNLQDDASRAS